MITFCAAAFPVLVYKMVYCSGLPGVNGLGLAVLLIRSTGACTVMVPVASVKLPDAAVIVPVPLVTGVKVVETPDNGARRPLTTPVPPHVTLRAPMRLLYTS